MRIQFLGGAGTVTGSMHLATTVRSRVLVDCGLFHGSATETAQLGGGRMLVSFDDLGRLDDSFMKQPRVRAG